MRLSIHTHAGHITHIHYRTATWNMREKDARSSVGPRPGHEAWEEVPQRPVIERVTAIVVIVIVMIIDIDVVIRPVARKHKTRIERPRQPLCRLLPEHQRSAKGFSKRTASAIGRGHKEDEQERSPGRMQGGHRGRDCSMQGRWAEGLRRGRSPRMRP